MQPAQLLQEKSSTRVRKTYLLAGITLLCSFAFQTYAQISGLVIDKATSQPVPFVSVALYVSTDSVALSGTLTDTTGRYHIQNPKSGPVSYTHLTLPTKRIV